jgi:Na+-translocating ferredoxin:NAD+ oxidoreductase RnfE subunit
MNCESRPSSLDSLAPDRTAGLAELIAAIVPSLAAAVSVSAALWMSTAVVVSLVVTSLVAALVARRMPAAVCSFAVLLAAAVLACGFELAASAWLPLVRASLGIYLPLSVILLTGPVAAAAFGDARPARRTGRAAVRALRAGLAFLGCTGLIALAREALGAGTVTLPGFADGRVFRLPALSEAPARALLAPFAGLIAAGYLAGLVSHFARRAARNKDTRSGGEAAR